MKRVFLVHGWGGTPDENWFPWLKKELEEKGFEVFIPQLPNSNTPRINDWVSKLSETVGEVGEETYFVSHSMGCQTVARFLETLPADKKVGGAIFVAGFFKRLTNIGEDENSKNVEKEWLKTPINLVKVKSHLEKSVAIFSDNDNFVPLDNQDEFREKLGSEIVIEHQKGHFSGNDKIFKLPIVLESLLKMSK